MRVINSLSLKHWLSIGGILGNKRKKSIDCGHILKALMFELDLTSRRVSLKMLRPRVRNRVVSVAKESVFEDL